MAHDEFRTDQAAIWLAGVELGLEFTDVVQALSQEFGNNQRRMPLKITEQWQYLGQIRLKML